jgi:hypothetical protein
MRPNPVQLDLNLKANNVSITEIARLVAASGMALPPATTINGAANVDLRARRTVVPPATREAILRWRGECSDPSPYALMFASSTPEPHDT